MARVPYTIDDSRGNCVPFAFRPGVAPLGIPTRSTGRSIDTRSSSLVAEALLSRRYYLGTMAVLYY